MNPVEERFKKIYGKSPNSIELIQFTPYYERWKKEKSLWGTLLDSQLLKNNQTSVKICDD